MNAIVIVITLVYIACCQIEVTESFNHTIFAYPENAIKKSTLRIIGGDNVTPNSYPFQAALFIYYKSKTNLCGGSLIDKEWILTAAHCVDNDPVRIVVKLGLHDVYATQESTVQIYEAKSYYKHSKWNEKTLQNDIALIKLPRNATLNNYVNLIKIGDNIDYAGRVATVLGWGSTEDGQISKYLKKVDVDVMTNQACKAVRKEFNEIIVSTHLCTSGQGIRGSCSGDSGGPLIVDGVQIGLVSFGPENCMRGFPSVFTRVPKFASWITSTKRNSGTSLNVNSFVICIVSLMFFINISK
ncbi:brachyurin [Diabrotica virgifera virgifera]|uniref:Peptidase S1 domain-containing protein n=1 Tax=Diabrotica virgifera virgifera TaxID=50390 RepID=A0ABM5IPR3_DIAVI|nr:brachyurin [Diabrotica virgifera virgifera]